MNDDNRYKLDTKTWNTYVVFDTPVNGSSLAFWNKPLPLPEGVDELVRENWDNELKAKQATIPGSIIKPYHKDLSQNPLNAIYDANGKCFAWPGPGISLSGDIHYEPINLDSDDILLFIDVGQTSYPFSAAAKDPRIVELYKSQNIPFPGPILGISTFAKTLDDQLSLTVRGPKVRWPDRFYAPGGQPEYVTENIVTHQLDELSDELMIGMNDYLYGKRDFIFGGIVQDKEIAPGKPELVGWVNLNLTSEDIKYKVRSRPLDKRPNDVIDVAFAPAKEGQLFEYLTHAVKPEQFVSMTHGGLVLYGLHNFGDEWAQDLLKKLG